MKKKTKTKRIEIRVTEEEFGKFKTKAMIRHDGNVSKFIRALALGSIFGKRRKQ